jgi:hypothetical protein
MLATCAFALGLSGCYSPRIRNGGFACSSTDTPSCPTGFYCVNGLCEDSPNSGGGGGVGGNGTPDLASRGDLASSVVHHDMSSTTAPEDMVSLPDLEPPPPPPDMTMCLPSGSFCTSSKSCCSKFCFLFSC